MAQLQPGEETLPAQKRKEAQRVRRIIAETHVFVRSQEINRTLQSFTLDHYIEEAKRKISGTGREIRDGAGEAFDLRPTKLESLNILEDEFRATLTAAREMAKAADASLQEDSQDEDADTRTDG
jgi:hypothetical protein